VVFYIAIYSIYWNQGYQKPSPIEGVLYTKVKGVALDQYGAVYDSGDLIQPPTEANALFIVTQFINTYQKEDTYCADPEAPCTTSADCVPGSFTSNGAVQPTCNTTFSACVIQGWCPVENDTLPVTTLSRIANWTLFMRTHVTYTVFNLTANNADQATLGYNIFALNTLLPTENWTQMAATGAIVSVKIDWACNLDMGVQNCHPTYETTRVDTIGSASVGFNYRRAVYVVNSNPNSNSSLFPDRVYSKLYGLRFVFQITGTGRKFDFATTIVTVGSGVAFFGIATVVVDFILLYFHPRKETFDAAKRDIVHLGHAPTESEA